MLSKLAIFNSGSTTYFYSSLFFPAQVRRDVFTLYAYVRVVDDFVDKQPANPVEFANYLELTRAALSGKVSGSPLIDDFVSLACAKDFDTDWIEAFWASMESDLKHKKCLTLTATKQYMFGSAEVIGLMMNRIMNLESSLDEPAKHLGRTFQYINFIRDINEDESLGRQYIPQSHLERFHLPSLSYLVVSSHKRQFESLINYELDLYQGWSRQARTDLKLLPLRLRLPITTALDMYDWTASQIRSKPFTIYSRKIKPTPLRVLVSAIINSFNMK